MVENGWTPRRQAMAHDQVHEAIGRARATTAQLAALDATARDTTLRAAADALVAGSDELAAAHALDLQASGAGDGGPSLTAALVVGLADRLRRIAELPDPLAATCPVGPPGTYEHIVRVPLGIVGVVHDAQPSAVVEAIGLALKAGNAVLLRGSPGTLNTDTALTEVLRVALAEVGLPADAVQLLASTERSCTRYLVSAKGLVDLILLRGSARLVRIVSADVSVPLIEAGPAVCHLYVDAAADLALAERVARDSSARTVLLHPDVADRFVPLLVPSLRQAGFGVHGDPRVAELAPDAAPATDDGWRGEDAARTVAVGVVDSLEAAIAHIGRFGTGHTEAIVTQSQHAARRFVTAIDAASVRVNAPIGTSNGLFATQKLQVRGPIGPGALTTTKQVHWIIDQDCA